MVTNIYVTVLLRKFICQQKMNRGISNLIFEDLIYYLFVIFKKIVLHIKLCNKPCEINKMATNLDIDDELIVKAKKIGNHKTKKETVTNALVEYIEKKEQKKVKELFGKIEYDEGYSYKKHRSRK